MKMNDSLWVTNEVLIMYCYDTCRTSIDTPPAPIEESRELGLCNGFRIWVDPTKEMIERCAADGSFVMVDFWPGIDRAREWAKHHNMTLEEYMEDRTALMKESVKKYGDKFWWTTEGEMDTQCLWPTGMMSSKKEAAEYFLNFMKKYVPEWDPEQNVNWTEFLKEHDVDMADGNIAIQCGFLWSTHYNYEIGARFSWLENNCKFLPNTQLNIVFARGAASQYRANDVYWGLDFSTWSQPSDLPTHYDKDGNRIGGCTESLLLRQWLTTVMSGANHLHQETADVSHWVTKEDGTKVLSPLGKLAQKFYGFCSTQLKDRPVPYVPVAVMLERDHGWLPSAWGMNVNKIWCGTLPYKKADATIDAFFEHVFPEHGQTDKGLYDQFVDQPWEDSDDYIKKHVKDGDDRARETGWLVPNKWGDVVDVVNEKCSAEVLDNYEILFLQGEIKMTPQVFDTVKQYVTDGGTAVINVTSFLDVDEDYLASAMFQGYRDENYNLFIDQGHGGKILPGVEELCGVKLTGQKNVSCFTRWKESGEIFKELGVTFERIELAGAEVIADAPQLVPGLMSTPHPDDYVSNDPRWSPVATQYAVGKGKVILTLPYFMLQPSTRQSLKLFGCMCDKLVDPILPLHIEGKPIQHMIGYRDGQMILTLINNSEDAWKGEIVTKEPMKLISEMWENKVVDSPVQQRFEVAVEPWEFVVLCFELQK